MASIQPTKLVADPIGNKPAKAEAPQPADPFAAVFKSQQIPTPNTSDPSKAIQHFYDLHQRSQITGVPTAVYNAAIVAMGLDPVKDPFAGIKALQQAGFETGSPSLEAILKYGAQPLKQGNQSYMQQDTVNAPATPLPPQLPTASTETDPDKSLATQPEAMFLPDDASMAQELEWLNRKHNNLLGPATNYFEAATHLATQIDLAPYKKFTLHQALPLIAQSLKLNESLWTTDRWLNSKTVDPN